MKAIIVLASMLVSALAIPTETYDLEFENLNVQEIFDSERLLKNYGYCFIEKGPCTPEAAKLKKIIPDALRTECTKCTPKQKELARTMIKGFQTKLPDLWDELSLHEDPKGEFKEAFEKFLNASD